MNGIFERHFFNKITIKHARQLSVAILGLVYSGMVLTATFAESHFTFYGNAEEVVQPIEHLEGTLWSVGTIGRATGILNVVKKEDELELQWSCPKLTDCEDFTQGVSAHFIYQSMERDGNVVVRLKDHPKVTQGYLSLTLQDTLELGATSVSLQIDLLDGFRVDWLYQQSNFSADILNNQYFSDYPQWLKLEREGAQVEAFVSSDGEQWESLGAVDIGTTQKLYAGIKIHGFSVEESVTAVQIDHLSLVENSQDISGIVEEQTTDLDTSAVQSSTTVFSKLINMMTANKSVFELTGDIGVSTTLVANTIYNVTDNVKVLADVTLTVPEGVEFTFADGKKLTIDGSLEVVGTSDEPVIFTSSSSSPAKSKWTGLLVSASGSVDLDYVEIAYATRAVDVYGDAIIRHSLLHDNTYGLYARINSAPQLIDGNRIYLNTYGIYAYGNNNETDNPAPVVTGNAIYDNSSYNYRAYYFGNPASSVLNAQGNWWGTAIVYDIPAKIYDFSDQSTYAPVVDYRGYQLTDGGELTDTTQQLVSIAGGAITSLTNDTDYEILGDLYIPSDATLSVGSGTTFSVVKGMEISVDGTLNIQGSADNLVRMASISAVPKKSDWIGIKVNAGGILNLDYLEIVDATRAIDVYGEATIQHSLLHDNTYGVYVRSDSNLVLNSGNELYSNTYGVYIKTKSSPQITGSNRIHDNTYGIYAYGNNKEADNPAPVVTGNAIYDNSTYNYYAYYFGNNENTLLNAQGNWWGTGIAYDIPAKIYDYSDQSSYAPVVDYRGYQLSDGGELANAAQQLVSVASGAITSLPNDSHYEILGDLYISSDATLSVGAGTTFSMVKGMEINVDGTLDIQGSADNLVTMSSISTTPKKSDWIGIKVNAGGILNLDYLEIADATRAIDVYGEATIQHSLLHDNTYGVYVRSNSSVALNSGNELYGNTYGVYIQNKSSPQITDGNRIHDNTYGIYAYGNNKEADNPAPVVTGNAIYNNSTYNYYAYYFGNNENTLLNAQNNWWGNGTVSDIPKKIYDYRDQPSYAPVVDYRGYQQIDGGSPSDAAQQLIWVASGQVTTLTNDAHYEILSDLYIAADATLMVGSGTSFSVVEDADISVEGILEIQGTADSPVSFNSIVSLPNKSDWTGIIVKAGGSLEMHYGEITDATRALDVYGAASVTHSEIYNNTYGLYARINSSPQLTDGNRIYANTYGIYAYGNNKEADNPAPVVTGNAIYNNSTYNYYAYYFGNNENTLLNAQNNWWGTNKVSDIPAKIYDYRDQLNYSPVVDYRGYQQTDGGPPSNAAQQLISVTSGEVTTLTNDSHYEILSDLYIAADATLMVGSGTSFSVVEDADISVEGVLDIQGTEDNPVSFGSIASVPNKSDWVGIIVKAGGSLEMHYGEITDAVRALDVYGAASVTHSKIHNNTYGLYARINSAPQLTDDNRIYANSYGIYVYGNNKEADNPAPVVTGNAIYDNSTYNYYAYYFGNNENTVLNAQDNWWGSGEPSDIAAKIYDYNDQASYSPVVDYQGFIATDGGESGGNNQLTSIPGGTTVTVLEDGVEYDVLGELYIAPEASLVIGPGTKLNFYDGTGMVVDGTLTVSGSAELPISLTSGNESASKSDWQGIVINAGGQLTLDYAEVAFASKALDVYGDATVTHSQIHDNTHGIYVRSGSSLALNNGNALYNNTYGVYIQTNSSPQITDGNRIYANSYGIYVYGNNIEADNPAPAVTGNAIYDNTTYNYYTHNFGNNENTVLNAQGNWWGTTDPSDIAAKIYDYSDGVSYSPVVDYRGYQLSDGGELTNTAQQLISIESGVTTTLTNDSQYEVLGDLFIAADAILSIGAGTSLSFVKGGEIQIEGRLEVQGTVDNLVHLTSVNSYPQKADWQGIVVKAAGQLTLDYAEVAFATKALDVYGDATVTHSQIHDNTHGIYVRSGSSLALNNGNALYNNTYGVYIQTNSSPQITDGNRIYANSYGIYVYGNNIEADNPAPAVTGNAIYDNTTYNYYAHYFGNNEYVVLNAQNNWWGASEVNDIIAKIYDYSDNPTNAPIVDFRGFLLTQDGSASDASHQLLSIPGGNSVTLLEDGKEYEVIANLFLAPEASLIIGPGTKLNFFANTGLVVDGTLTITGELDNPVTLTSAKENPVKNDWQGIVVNAGGQLDLSYAEIAYANKGLDIYGELEVSNTSFHDNTYGVYIRANTSPLISDGNRIYNNSYGIYAVGDNQEANNPTPVVTGNAIYSNTYDNYRTASFGSSTTARFHLLNAQGNWWGSSDVETIKAEIYDAQDSSTSKPTVDFRGYLLSDNGAATDAAAQLIAIEGGNQTVSLTPGVNFQVLAPLYVGTETKLQINADTTLAFEEATGLTVDGELEITGTEDNPVQLTSINASPSRSDWVGVVINEGAVLTLSYAEISYAIKALDIFGDATVSQSNMHDNKYGVYINSKSSPLIQNENQIVDNQFGIYVVGDLILENNPAPVVTNNSIHDNDDYNFYVKNFGGDSGVENIYLNAQNNWWGSDNIGAISRTLYDLNDALNLATNISTPFIDYRGYLMAENGSQSDPSRQLITLPLSELVEGVDTIVLIPNAQYQVLSTLKVQENDVLDIVSGTEMSFAHNVALTVEGKLLVTGEDGNRARFTSGSVSKNQDDWRGLDVKNGWLDMRFADVSYASVGIKISSVEEINITNSLIHNNDNGVHIYLGNPKIQTKNRIYDNNIGIKLCGCGNDNYANSIKDPTTGIYYWVPSIQDAIASYPKPIVNGNSIYNNIEANFDPGFSYDYNDDSGRVVITYMIELDATRNWWGTSLMSQIRAKFKRHSGAFPAISPSIDYSGFLLAEDGEGSDSTYQITSVPYGETMTLEAGETYTALDNLWVRDDTKLEMGSGSTVIFQDGMELRVIGGELNIQGTESNPVRLTSLTKTPGYFEWKGIKVDSGILNMAYAEVSFAEKGLDIQSPATASIQQSDIHHNNYGVYTRSSNTLINNNNNIHDNIYGVYTYGSSPTITNGNRIYSNDYGIYSTGFTATALEFQPTPVITGNAIFDNYKYNFYTKSFGSSYVASKALINTQNNWWGTANIAEIADTLYDQSDINTSPIIDYRSFQLSDGGVASDSANQLVSFYNSDDELQVLSVQSYDVLGSLFVDENDTLSIPAGVHFNFASGAAIYIDGTLNVEGESSDPVMFSSARMMPERSDWKGIIINENGSLDLSNVDIAYAVSGVDIYGSANITESSIHDNNAAIYVRSKTSPAIQDNNRIFNNKYGLYVIGSNVYSENPTPVMTNNALYDNDAYHFYAMSFGLDESAINPTLNLQDNWWGSSDINEISKKIYDYSNSITNTPIADYRSFKLGDGGNNSDSASQLLGFMPETISLINNQSYAVLNPIIVTKEGSLNIGQGTQLVFNSGSYLQVDGGLNILGSEQAPVIFNSAAYNQKKGDWKGIIINQDASVRIEQLNNQFAAKAIDIIGASDVEITDSFIGQFSTYGVSFTKGSTATLQNSLIDNETRSATGIYIYGASPTIRNNIIRNTSYGIVIASTADHISNPVIIDNTITQNSYGIQITGYTSDDSLSPQPSINNNDIYDNITNDLRVLGYSEDSQIVLDFENNYWGENGGNIYFGNGVPATIFNPVNSLSEANQNVAISFDLENEYFSPNDNGIKDTLVFNAELVQSGSWTLRILHPTAGLVKSYQGTGSEISLQWDGLNELSQTAQDSRYTLELLNSNNQRILMSSAVLDNILPQALISNPVQDDSVFPMGELMVAGIASDDNLDSYQIEYKSTVSSEWNDVSGIITNSVDNNNLAVWDLISTSLPLTDGSYQLKLSVADLAGNQSSYIAEFQMVLVDFRNVSVTNLMFNPANDETAEINFELSQPASVILEIYPERGGELLYSQATEFSDAGAHVIYWDGKDKDGNLVVDEAYEFVLRGGSAAGGSGTYRPTEISANKLPSAVIDASFNVDLNDDWKSDVTITKPGRITLRATINGTTRNVVDNVPYGIGTHLISWDGRLTSGEPVYGTVSLFLPDAISLKTNSVIVKGTQLKIQGNFDEAPQIEVKSDPYLIVHSFEQFSVIDYAITQDSYVTVKILPPGVYDPEDNRAIVVTDSELLIAKNDDVYNIHSASWQAYSDADTNNIDLSEEGVYTYTIEVSAIASGQTALRRGSLTMYQ